ncbi:helix-turn-helix domain-containing protein [Bacillus sp. UNC41MFS5]|uniref:helix-turn-helix domain-containing protein n=1 Tax=Bacillus sp. UNC41MFS5 TaxID=1449046 RepID=UPI0009DCC791|nr:helix-turn-helix transcriptional regulator [Bacillus sp. UNC41MFS5]
MSFGKYLKVKREEKNLSMNKLGELVGITAMYISQLESGKRNNPSIEVLHKLSKSLEVPNEELMEAAGYIGSRTMEVEDFIEELRETISQERENIETQSVPQEEQEQFKLDSLLDSNHQIFFQDRLLTKEEKTKIRSVIEIVLKD